MAGRNDPSGAASSAHNESQPERLDPPGEDILRGLATLLDALPVAVAVYDAGGRALHVSPTLQRMLDGAPAGGLARAIDSMAIRLALVLRRMVSSGPPPP